MDPIPQQNPGFLQKYKFTLISLLIIILAAVPLLLLSNTATKKPAQQQTTALVSPTPAPLTTNNADDTLNQADTDLESTLNQSDSDLQTQSQVDASQDSTAGL